MKYKMANMIFMTPENINKQNNYFIYIYAQHQNGWVLQKKNF